MRSLVWLLIILGVVCFLVGGLTAFLGLAFRIPPEGYWRGATGLWVLAIALRQMEQKGA